MIGDITGMIAMLVFWTFLAVVIVGPMWMRHRERQNMQDIVRVAYEKGQPVSPELINAIQSSLAVKAPSTRESDLRRAIIFLAIGLGLVLLGYGIWYGLMSVDDEAAYISGGCTAGAGAIPGMIGIAYLILWATGRKKSAITQSSSAPTLGQS
ncbi:MAG TPA: DUF6249 domain-containing protein [Caulobacteraceae bacterium]|jgi:hypothetical protein